MAVSTVTVAPPSTREALEVLRHRESPSMAGPILADVGISIASGQGCTVIDEAGRRYLDLTAGSGVLALGHGHPAVRAAMHEQLDTFVHGGWQLGCPARAAVTEQLMATLPWPDPMVAWCTTGSEAVETALKVARIATGRRAVAGFLGGYHGKTAGALTVTANSAFRAGVTDGPTTGLSLPYPAAAGYVDRSTPSTDDHDFGQRILEHPDFGIDDLAGIIVEPVQGAGGMQAAAPGFLPELAQVAQRHGVLLIADEIFTGFGRTGSMYAVGHDAVVPDLLVLGKALGGGLPLSAVVGPRDLLEQLPPLRQTSTFSANPLACAAGSVVLSALTEDDVIAHGAARAAQLATALGSVEVPGVRLALTGRGLMLGLRVLAAPRAVGPFTQAVVRRLRTDFGVLALRGGSTGSVIKWTPSLTITAAEIQQSVDAVRAALVAEATAGPTP